MNGDGDTKRYYTKFEVCVTAESQRTPEKSQTSFAAFEAGRKQRIRIGLEYVSVLRRVTLNRV